MKAYWRMLIAVYSFQRVKSLVAHSVLKPILGPKSSSSRVVCALSKNNEPKTGWLHNKAAQESEEPTLPSTTQIKTGWLHRKEPRAKEEALQQELQQIVTSAAATSSTPASTSSTFELARQLQNTRMNEFRNHRMISPPTLYPSGEEGRVIVVTEHEITVPLKRNIEVNFDKQETFTLLDKSQPTINVYFGVVDLLSSHKESLFFKSLVSLDPKQRAQAYVSHCNLENMDKGIVYLQGGPGFGAPTPISGIGLTSKSSWAGAALSSGFTKIVFMDQRGTGRSTPITKQTLQRRFPDLFLLDDLSESSQSDDENESISSKLERLKNSYPDQVSSVEAAIIEAVDYLSQFRADNIVHDAEQIKEALLMPQTTSTEPRPWGAALGQSYGGFCVMSYLSLIPHPPSVCLLTGGIAPMCTPVHEVYSSLAKRVKERNLLYYKRYPEDAKLVKRLVQRLLAMPATLPSGGKLTARRFLQLGMHLGGTPSSFASLHATLATAFLDDESQELSKAFLKHLDSVQPFDDHPIYFLLHESIYADANGPTNWAAHSVLQKSPEWDFSQTVANPDQPTLFLGEMVFPWMAKGDYAECSGLGFEALANGLAIKDDWTALFNTENMRRTLESGHTVAAAAVYTDDMYVDYDACRMVTQPGGPLEECKLYITNEYQHSGLRDDGAAIFTKLYGMALGSVGVPS